MQGLKGTRPYFVRAIYDWLLDRQLTPYLLVNANWPTAELPMEFAQDGQLVLNMSPTAIRQLSMGNEAVLFSARFSGKAMSVVVPIGAILGVYAKENGQGLFFDPDEYSPEPIPPSQDEGTVKQRPSLRVVK